MHYAHRLMLLSGSETLSRSQGITTKTLPRVVLETAGSTVLIGGVFSPYATARRLTLVRWLKMFNALSPPIRARVDMISAFEDFNMLLPTELSKDCLLQAPIGDNVKDNVTEYRVLISPSRTAYLVISDRWSRSRSTRSPTVWASTTTALLPVRAMASGFRSLDDVLNVGSTSTTSRVCG